MISTWIDDGVQVILMIDADEIVTSTKSGSFCHKIEEASLNELILSQHLWVKSLPIRIPGTQTIDGIFGTPELNVINGGHAPFFGFTDYRLSWLDIQ